MGRSKSRQSARSRGICCHRGFTLVELMVSITIGIFLIGAVLTILQANRTVFGDQNLLAQLQDNERMALSTMSDVIQTAGYFPDPTTNTAGTEFLAAAPFAALQTMTGLYGGGAAPGDQLEVRYVTAAGDGILNCSGGSNTTAGPVTYVSVFQVSAATSQLICTMNGTQYALASGVTNMTVLYGVQTNLAGATRNVDTYMNASQVTANGAWGNIVSALVALTFTNPLYNVNLPQGQPATITVQRVMNVMGVTGPAQ